MAKPPKKNTPRTVWDALTPDQRRAMLKFKDSLR